MQRLNPYGAFSVFRFSDMQRLLKYFSNLLKIIFLFNLLKETLPFLR